jgi:hypothetical protein
MSRRTTTLLLSSLLVLAACTPEAPPAESAAAPAPAAEPTTSDLRPVAEALQPAAARELIQDIYARRYPPDETVTDGGYDASVHYSKSLSALFAEEAARTPDDEVGAIDFDVFTNAQDWSLSQLQVAEAVAGETPERCQVDVTFMNGDRAEHLRFSMLLEADEWKIDDIASLGDGGGEGWTLRGLLAPPAGP